MKCKYSKTNLVSGQVRVSKILGGDEKMSSHCEILGWGLKMSSFISRRF